MTKNIRDLQPGKAATGEFMINAIDVYRISSKVNKELFFSIASKRNRGHQMKLAGGRLRKRVLFFPTKCSWRMRFMPKVFMG